MLVLEVHNKCKHQSDEHLLTGKHKDIALYLYLVMGREKLICFHNEDNCNCKTGSPHRFKYKGLVPTYINVLAITVAIFALSIKRLGYNM
jgi:hypothetical protein